MLSKNVSDNSISYLSKVSKKSSVIYWTILLVIGISLLSLPYIKLDISVKASGIVRPVDEKTDLKSSITTTIDSIYFKEGDTLKKGDVIVALHKENLSIKRTLNDFEIKQRNEFIADLLNLTHVQTFDEGTLRSLQNPVYKQQASRFIYQLTELNILLKKINKEVYIDSVLSIDRVIAPKEMFDKLNEKEKLIANIKTTKEQQIATWQQELANYKLERSQYANANNQLDEDSNLYMVKAPIGGVIQNFNKYYTNSLVQAGEVIGTISPQASLVSECYVSSRDVGLLKINQSVLYQIDAFDYKYFGILKGRILSIDNDFTPIDNKPMFKVRCSLEKERLDLQNGFAGALKKGMTMQARFLITRRSLWQLMFDKIDDWLNPSAPENK